MTTFRQRKHWLAIVAIVFVFAACKGDTPTAPSPGTGPSPGPGPTPTPTGVAMTLTVSNATPLVDSTSIITATVTENGQPVPNGTAVEFQTNLGVFSGPDQASVIRTTTNGVATVTLTSGTAGTARVTAVVANVTRTADVTFRPRPTVDPPPNTAPTITSVAPGVGRPAGGETIRIQGTNFRAPVRVLFDLGNGTTREAFVVSVTPTVIEVITPGVDLATSQQLQARIIVISEAGTANEQRAEAASPFVFRAEVLTPRVVTVSPNSAPINGGTRVTVFGDGFQAPVQVLFGLAEARVIEVRFDQIIVQAPPGRDTAPNGSDPVLGPIDVTIININSATRVTAPSVFRYAPKAVITAAGPTEGPSSGGTRVTIDGTGFDDPVAVVIGGVAAQPIFVSGTRIVAITSPIVIENCEDETGPIVVTNIENGDTATGPDFTYRALKPIILGVQPTSGSTIVPGATIQVRVLNPGQFPQLVFGSGDSARGLPISGITDVGGGQFIFTSVVPSNIQLQTRTCPSGGTAPVSTSFDITYTSLETECTVTLRGGLNVEPRGAGSLFTTPNPLNIAATADDPATPADEEVDGSGTFTVVNNGAAPLTITSVNSNNPAFTITSNPSGTTLAVCESTIVSVAYEAGAPGATAAQITVTATTGNPATTVTATETVVATTTRP